MPGVWRRTNAIQALEGFFGGDDAGEDVCTFGIDSCSELLAECFVLAQFLKVVRVENDEHALLNDSFARSPLRAETGGFPVELIAC